jgi:hypothetical protein
MAALLLRTLQKITCCCEAALFNCLLRQCLLTLSEVRHCQIREILPEEIYYQGTSRVTGATET